LVGETTSIEGLLVINCPGANFEETNNYIFFQKSWANHPKEFVQTNINIKSKNCIVGFHYHLLQFEIWHLLAGKAKAYFYDFRIGSPTEGVICVKDLEADLLESILIPPGVAHLFISHTEVILETLVDQYYNPSDELGIFWSDPALGINWNIENPILSNRDKNNPKISQIPTKQRPVYI
jgi:dTDP-4-dehydrorhamnose 3,5-epimerase